MTLTLNVLTYARLAWLLPEARKGRAAVKFVAYVEDALKQIGAKENITVKDREHGGQDLSGLGYKHVDDGINEDTGYEQMRLP